MKLHLRSFLIALFVAAAPMVAQAQVSKIAVLPIDGNDGLRAELSKQFAAAGFSVVDAGTVDAAAGKLGLPSDYAKFDSGHARQLGGATGAEVVVTGRVLGSKVLTKLLSARTAAAFGEVEEAGKTKELVARFSAKLKDKSSGL